MTFAGIDPIYDPVPVRPGAHYTWRRRDDNDGATELTGCTPPVRSRAWSVHGANRLGGNSLMETITFGRRAGRAAAEWALSHTTIDVPVSAETDAERELKAMLDVTGGERPWQIRQDLGRLDVRELRRLPPRGSDGTADRDPRRAQGGATTAVS